MRVHVFLLTFLAVSTLAKGAPESMESEVESRVGEADEAVYQKSFQTNAPPLPGNSRVQGGDVYISVSKWTLETLYDFLNGLYEKLKVIVAGREEGGGGGGGMEEFTPPALDSPGVTKQELLRMYSVLMVIYDLVTSSGGRISMNNGAVKSYPNSLAMSMAGQQQQQTQRSVGYQPADNFYSQFGAGANPMAYANGLTPTKASQTRKRSYGSQQLEGNVFKRVARKTVANILKKLDAEMTGKKEEEEKKENGEDKKKTDDNPAKVEKPKELAPPSAVTAAAKEVAATAEVEEPTKP